MDSPCKECLCVPICRNKTYGQLTGSCSLVFDYLYDTRHQRREGFLKKTDKMILDLEPIGWGKFGETLK